MTTTAVTVRPRPHRPLMVLSTAMAGLAVVTALGIFLDPRVLTGMPIWAKPFKFAVSFAVYGFTLAWMLSVLPRRSRVAEWAAAAIVGVAVIEQGVIVLQAARGVTSHYNETTSFDAALWSAMSMSIMVLFLAHVVIALTALRQRLPDRVVGTGIRLGLGGSLLGLLAAGPMVFGPHYGAHSVGVPDGGPGMPLTGWSSTGGDLRIGHFVGLHALQALPLLAFLLNRYASRLEERTRVRLLVVACGAYGVLVGLLTWQALRAQPLLKPDAPTLAAVAALVVATAAAAGLVLTRDRSMLTPDRTA